MIFYYGSYSHDDNEVNLAGVDIQNRYADGVPQSRIVRYTLEGRKHAADVAALTTALAAMEAAYQTDGYSFGLTGTQHVVNSGDSIGGTRVVSFGYPVGGGGQYTTYRDFSIVLEVEFPNTAIGILSWTERLIRIGTGGPRIIWREALTGPPQAQQVRQSTICRTVQTGTATGNGSYPNPPAPLWPDYELVDQREVSPQTPRRVGRSGKYQYTEWSISWTYVYESPFILNGFPNLPPN